MADRKYSVTSYPRTDHDYALAIYTINAKYDLNHFIEDGDLADQQIQEAKAREEAAMEERHQLETNDLSHSLVQRTERAKSRLQTIRLVAKAAGVQASQRHDEMQGESEYCHTVKLIANIRHRMH